MGEKAGRVKSRAGSAGTKEERDEMFLFLAFFGWEAERERGELAVGVGSVVCIS